MRTSAVAMLLVTVMAGMVLAQPPEGMGNRRAMERLEHFKKIRMVEALDLDEETGVKLVSRYNKHRERMKDLESERKAVIEKLGSLVGGNATEGEYQKCFTELNETEKRIAEVRKRFMDDLKEVLTTKQIAQYLIFERDFMKDVRNAVKDVQRERLRR